ncbi:A24 family peptidase [Paenibacillus sp. MMS20-IR301]|uniref:A24 family peptidase n=1 Tax=Paenibacillus sp. MMS20-IR301 TaxID=2895946 RepID=UPI0028EC77A0|nr:A24 family peptidase [Paenibacillus sp. MMS20-IR301]WNS41031.1 A24 family peptidase [Paenibacillus sp. MMS20-IR301]
MTDWAFWGCLAALTIALFTDIRWLRIPNWITLPVLVTGMSLQLAVKGWPGLIFSLCGAAAGFALLLIMYFIGAVGAGDVKLFAGIGAWTGTVFTLQVIVYSILLGAVVGWGILFFRRGAGQKIRTMLSRTAGFLLLRTTGMAAARQSSNLLRFPFMLAVYPGFICAYYYF